jgi:hypothetical protein
MKSAHTPRVYSQIRDDYYKPRRFTDAAAQLPLLLQKSVSQQNKEVACANSCKETFNYVI